eukprot:1698168-Pyramimonas_sp.AAC.1
MAPPGPQLWAPRGLKMQAAGPYNAARTNGRSSRAPKARGHYKCAPAMAVARQMRAQGGQDAPNARREGGGEEDEEQEAIVLQPAR